MSWFAAPCPARQTELQGWYRLDQPSILDLSPSTGVQEVLRQATVQVAEGEPPADVPMDVDADEIKWSGSTSPPPSFALNAEQPAAPSLSPSIRNDDEDVVMEDAWELDRDASATMDTQSSGPPASRSDSRDSSPIPEPGTQVKNEEDGRGVDVYPPPADEDHSSAKGRTGRGRKEKHSKSQRHAARSPSPVACRSKAEIHVHRSANEKDEATGLFGELAHMAKQFERLARASEHGVPTDRTVAMCIYFSSAK
ncbi:hypothetical protein EWM64_g9075 [Hericium alpestre]|uniref:Uncharacterized protein n=1 Tax=Hericium alpestre TaxID=135208 RepID=A0A4Y9ZLG8_9AGAM|nr:hypothetical protein EWM64_g9075 [Hericium alpestre]